MDRTFSARKALDTFLERRNVLAILSVGKVPFEIPLEEKLSPGAQGMFR
jgi:hypothetical protein